MTDPSPSAISELLEKARASIERYEPAVAAAKMQQGALLIDLRPADFRAQFGEIPDAIIVSRHVLEWRLDVTSAWHLEELRPDGPDQEIILFCNEGYTSSLAAYQLETGLGLSGVKDIIGGFAAWQEAGLPTIPSV